MLRFALSLLVVFALPTSAVGQRIIYVDASVADRGDGTSWSTAFADLQDALAVALGDDEVWVAVGTYRPDLGVGQTLGDQQASFVLSRSVRLFGGFAGTEGTRVERDWTSNVTHLSGDLLGNDPVTFDPSDAERADNAHTVVVISSSLDGQPAVVDGFHVVGAGGGASGGGIRIDSESHAHLENLAIAHNQADDGAGLLSLGTFTLFNSVISENASVWSTDPSRGFGGGLRHLPDERNREGLPVARVDGVRFEGNRAGECGGGLHVFSPLKAADASLATLLVTNSAFQGNESQAGGGVCILGTLPSPRKVALIGVQFAENRAVDGTGGGIHGEEIEVEIYNALVTYNTARNGGAVSVAEGSTATIRHMTAFGNSAQTAAAVSLLGSGADIANSIFWDNSTLTGHSIRTDDNPQRRSIEHSISAGGRPDGFDGGSVLNVDPRFIATLGPDNRPIDFRLRADSPAIDSGANILVPKDAYDLDGDGLRGDLLPFDLDGNPRLVGGPVLGTVVDRGAYEYGAIDVSLQASPRALPACPSPFPNPTDNSLKLEPEGANARIELFDGLGRRLGVSVSGSGERLQLDVSTLPMGSYLASVVYPERPQVCWTGFVVTR